MDQVKVPKVPNYDKSAFSDSLLCVIGKLFHEKLLKIGPFTHLVTL